MSRFILNDYFEINNNDDIHHTDINTYTNKDTNNDNYNTNCNDDIFEKLLFKLETSISRWHENLITQIESNQYLSNFEKTNVNITTYQELIVSIVIHKELLCEVTHTVYIKNTESKYSLFDVYKLINKLINLNNQLSKTSVMLFSILLFQDMNIKQKFDLNLEQLSNQTPLIIVMIFYNELQKQIMDLNLKSNSFEFILENDIPKRNITESFIQEQKPSLNEKKQNFFMNDFRGIEGKEKF